MARSNNRSGRQGGEGWNPVRVFQLLAAVAQLIRALAGSEWDIWPHL